MCEILICVHNRGNSGNLAVDSHAPQVGDVVCAQADGWTWGACEMGQIVAGNPNGNHPFFRIVKMPNVTVAQVANLLTPELNTAADIAAGTLSPYLQYRGFYIDITSVGPNPTFIPLTSYWNDDVRAQPFLTTAISNTQLQSLVKQRTPIPFVGQTG